jgi:hypothetical protein
MPDLDLMKQGGTGGAGPVRQFAKGRSGNPAGRVAAATASTALPVFCSPAKAKH